MSRPEHHPGCPLISQSSKPARPTWDKEEWSAKAKEKDEAQADGAKDSEDAPQGQSSADTTSQYELSMPLVEADSS